MSWQDRPYSQQGDKGPYGEWGYGGGGGQMRLAFPKPPSAVKWLLIINLAVFFAQILTGDIPRGRGFVTGLFAAQAQAWWQIWRYVTFQFLHASIGHIGFNMLALYMLGTPLEQRFGTRRFLGFYLICGVAAGVAYVVMNILLVGLNASPIVGASGGIFGILVAAAVYLPQMRLVFPPVSIRVAAIGILVLAFFHILMGLRGTITPKFWSEVAHFGGALAGGAMIFIDQRRGGAFQPTEGLVEKIRKGQWQRKMADRQKTSEEVDRILEKIHQRGIASLTGKEKRLLKKATEQQREEDKRIRKL